VRKLRAILFTLLLGAITVHVMWVAIAPLVPYIISALVVVLILGSIYHRFTRW